MDQRSLLESGARQGMATSHILWERGGHGLVLAVPGAVDIARRLRRMWPLLASALQLQTASRQAS